MAFDKTSSAFLWDDPDPDHGHQRNPRIYSGHGLIPDPDPDRPKGTHPSSKVRICPQLEM